MAKLLHSNGLVHIKKTTNFSFLKEFILLTHLTYTLLFLAVLETRNLKYQDLALFYSLIRVKHNLEVLDKFTLNVIENAAFCLGDFKAIKFIVIQILS